MYCKLNKAHVLPFGLWGLNDLPGEVAPYSPHRLVFGRDPIAFASIPPPPPTVDDTGVEVATEDFRRAHGERQLVQIPPTDLHAGEYQAFLRKNPALHL